MKMIEGVDKKQEKQQQADFQTDYFQFRLESSRIIMPNGA